MTDPRIQTFLDELQRIMATNPDHPNPQFVIKEGPKFVTLGRRLQPPFNQDIVNTVTKIDKNTLDVYSASGTKPRGNLKDQFKGLDLISPSGIIVNRQGVAQRLAQIQGLPPKPKSPPTTRYRTLTPSPPRPRSPKAPSPKAPSPKAVQQPIVTLPYCHATTKAGKPCKREPLPGSDYCWQHKQ